MGQTPLRRQPDRRKAVPGRGASVHNFCGTRTTWHVRGRAGRVRRVGCEKGKAPRQGRCTCRGGRWEYSQQVPAPPGGAEVPAGTLGAEMFPKWNYRARLGGVRGAWACAVGSGEP